MDKQTFTDNLKALGPTDRGKIEALARYLAWKQHGGRKTPQIKRGEKIYKQLQLTEKA